MSSDLIKQEIKNYQALDKIKKEEYVKSSYKLQHHLEDTVRKYFSPLHNGDDIADIVTEQFRELSYSIPPEYTAEQEKPSVAYIAVACSRMVVYRTSQEFLNVIRDKPPEETARLILEKQKSTLGEKEKYREGEFISYMRGFAKYWSKCIDEDKDCEEVVLEDNLYKSLQNILDTGEI